MRPSTPPVLALAVLLGASCVPGGGLKRPDADAPWWRAAAPFAVGPYLLTRPGGGYAVVVHDPRLEGAPRLQWRVGERVRGRPMRRRAGLWVATLAPPAGARVTYRVQGRDGASAEVAFKAGEVRGRPFRFAAFGDTRTNHLVHYRVATALARENIDFVVHTGDLVEFGHLEREWLRFFAIERRLLARRPLLAAMGNHDLSNLGLFRRYCLLDTDPALPRHYHADWGDLRVVVLDQEVELREGSAQHEFVDRKLAEAAAAGKYLVIAVHDPPYSSGAHGSNESLRRTLRPLVRRHGVELVISGHDHHYERSRPMDGATYVVSGSAGAPIRPVRPQSFTAAARLEPHYVLVDVSARGLSLRAVNLHGHTFDSHVIAHNPPGGARGAGASGSPGR